MERAMQFTTWRLVKVVIDGKEKGDANKGVSQLRLVRETATLADTLAVMPEKIWCRAANHYGNSAENRVAFAVAKRRVHRLQMI